MSNARQRDDTRDQAELRRARTRQLIELGGLVHKAGLADLLQDDRAALYDALLELAARLRNGLADTDPAALHAQWRHRGLRAFEWDRQLQAEQASTASPGS